MALGGLKPTLHELARRVRSDEDPAAAQMIASRLLETDMPPLSFTEFVARVPDLAGGMTSSLFDLYADAWDLAVAHARIRGLPEAPEQPTV